MATGAGCFRDRITKGGKKFFEYRIERMSFYGYTKKECKDKYKAYLTKNEEQKLKQSNITMAKWAEKWLVDYKKDKLEYSTYKHIESLVRNHIVPIMGKLQVRSVSPANIERFNSEMMGYSFSLRRQAFNSLNQIFEAAEDNGICEKNPCRKVSVKDVKGEREDLKIKVFPRDELSLIIENAPKAEYGHYILLALYSGMRRGELIALKWSDIKNGTITITKAIGLAEHGQAEKCPKSRKPRIIGVTPQLQAVLDTIPHNSKYVLYGENNGAVSLNGFEVRYRKAFKDIQDIVGEENLHYLSPHKCRHTFATYLAENGASAKDVKTLLGHSSLAITQIYFHSDTQALIEATNKLPY